MIDKEKLKRAAEDFCMDRMNIITMGEKIRMRRYFTAGARWCYGALWHSIEAMPDARDGTRLLCIIESNRAILPFYCQVGNEDEWRKWVERIDIIAWAYEEALIPEEMTKRKSVINPDAMRKFYALDIGDIVTWTDGDENEWIGRVEGKDVDLNLEFYPCISRTSEANEWQRRSNYGNDTWTVNINVISHTFKSATEEQSEHGDSSVTDTFWMEVKRISELIEEEVQDE